MATDPHALALLDESSETALAVCACDWRFLVPLPDPDEARWQHMLHRQAAREAAGGHTSRPPKHKTRDEGKRSRSNRLSPETVAAILRMNEDGFSQGDIARELGLNRSTVGMRVKRSGVTAAHQVTPRVPQAAIDEAARMVESDGFSIADAAKRVGTSPQTLKARLIKMGRYDEVVAAGARVRAERGTKPPIGKRSIPLETIERGLALSDEGRTLADAAREVGVKVATLQWHARKRKAAAA